MEYESNWKLVLGLNNFPTMVSVKQSGLLVSELVILSVDE